MCQCRISCLVVLTSVGLIIIRTRSYRKCDTRNERIMRFLLATRVLVVNSSCDTIQKYIYYLYK